MSDPHADLVIGTEPYALRVIHQLARHAPLHCHSRTTLLRHAFEGLRGSTNHTLIWWPDAGLPSSTPGLLLSALGDAGVQVIIVRRNEHPPERFCAQAWEQLRRSVIRQTHQETRREVHCAV